MNRIRKWIWNIFSFLFPKIIEEIDNTWFDGFEEGMKAMEEDDLFDDFS